MLGSTLPLHRHGFFGGRGFGGLDGGDPVGDLIAGPPVRVVEKNDYGQNVISAGRIKDLFAMISSAAGTLGWLTDKRPIIVNSIISLVRGFGLLSD